jgi:hypothetical protein
VGQFWTVVRGPVTPIRCEGRGPRQAALAKVGVRLGPFPGASRRSYAMRLVCTRFVISIPRVSNVVSQTLTKGKAFLRCVDDKQ